MIRNTLIAFALACVVGVPAVLADGEETPVGAQIPPAMKDLVTTADPHYVRIDFNSLATGLLEGQSGGEGFAEDSTWDAGSSVIHLQDQDLVPPPPKPVLEEGLILQAWIDRNLNITLPDPNELMYVPSQYGTPRSVQGSTARARQQSRALAKSMDGTVWFRFLVRPVTEASTAGIGFNRHRSWLVRPSVVASGRQLVVRFPDENQDVIVDDVFTLEETALVVGRIEINAGPAGEDHLSIWVNPDVRDAGDPLLYVSKADFVGHAISRLSLISHGGAGDATGGELDEVILSNYPYPAAYYHVMPRLRYQGRGFHLPLEVATEVTPLPPEGYELVWSDEFEGDEVDETKWTYRVRGKADSIQLKENVEVKDGHLIIHLRQEERDGFNYTGGGVHSLETFVYGYFESRLKVPSAEGWHTAFWLFPEVFSTGTEIDFMEQDSGDPHLFSIGATDKRFRPWVDRNVGRWIVTDAPNMAKEFVVISGEFTPDYLRVYMNGHLALEMDSGIFPHSPMDVRLTSIATRKKNDRFQDDARLPDKAVFDYIRVYRHPKYQEAEAAARAEPQMRIDRLNPEHREEVKRMQKQYPPLLIDGLRTLN